MRTIPGVILNLFGFVNFGFVLGGQSIVDIDLDDDNDDKTPPTLERIVNAPQ